MPSPGPFVLTLAISLSLLAWQDSATDEVEGWLRERARTLSMEQTGVGFEEPCLLTPGAAEVDVVLLGEEVHGVHEFALLKLRMVRHLVEQHGFDTVALEQDTLSCKAMNDWILGGDSDPERALGNWYWCWNGSELLETLHWLREYNQGAERPVRFVGIDNQGAGGAARSLRDSAASLELPDLEAALVPFDGGLAEYQKLDEGQREEHEKRLAALGGALGQAAMQDGFERDEPLRRAVEALSVLEEVRELWSAPNTQARMNVRDRNMAVRTRALLGQEGTRVVLWAHNAHVERATFYGGVEPLGRHLSDSHRTLVVGFYFGQGEYLNDPRARQNGETTVIEAPPPGTLSVTLADVEGGTWAVDLRALPEAPPAVVRFFSAPPPGHFYNYSEPPSLLGALDVLVFVETVTPMQKR